MKTIISLSTPAQLETESLVAIVLDDADPAQKEKNKDANPQLKLATGDVFRKADDAARAVTGKRTEGMQFWQIISPDGSRKTLRQLRDQGKPKPAKSRRLQRPHGTR